LTRLCLAIYDFEAHNMLKVSARASAEKFPGRPTEKIAKNDRKIALLSLFKLSLFVSTPGAKQS